MGAEMTVWLYQRNNPEIQFEAIHLISLPLWAFDTHPYHTHSALTARYMHNKLIPHAASLDSEMHLFYGRKVPYN